MSRRDSPALPNPLALYLDNLAPSGKRSMRSLLSQATRIMGHGGTLEDFAWHRLGYGDVAKVRSKLLALGKSANTVNTTLAAIKGVMKTAFLLGQINAEAQQRIQAIKRVRHKPLPAGRSLRKTEFAALLRACAKDDTAAGARDAAILALLAGAGLRRGEAVALDVTDYSPRSGKIRIRHGKGNKDRELVLPPKARELIQRWLQERGKSTGPLFCPVQKNGELMLQRLSTQAIYDLVKRRAIEARIAPCSPHDLRRTFITRLLDNGVDINTTRQLAGHEDIQTTARYDRRNGKAGVRALARLAV